MEPMSEEGRPRTNVGKRPIPARRLERSVGRMQTYLVEHYRPGLTADDLRQAAALVRAAAAELQLAGAAVRYLRSTIVPTDEAFLSVFEAASEENVRATYARAGVPFERISLALQEEMT